MSEFDENNTVSRAGAFLQVFNELGLDSPHVYTTAFSQGKLVIQGTYVHPRYPQIVHTSYQTGWTEQQAKEAGVYTGSEVDLHGDQARIRSVTNNKGVVIPLLGKPHTSVQEVPKPPSDYPDQVKWINGAWRRHTPNGWVKDIAIPAAKVAGGALASGLVAHGLNKLFKTGESLDEAYISRVIDGKLQFVGVRTDLEQPKKVYTIYSTGLTGKDAHRQGIRANMHVSIHGDKAIGTDPHTGKKVEISVEGKPQVVVKDIPRPSTDDDGSPLDADSLEWHQGEWVNPADLEHESSWKDKLVEPLAAGTEAAIHGLANSYVRSQFGPSLRPGSPVPPVRQENDDDDEEENESIRTAWTRVSANALLKRYDEADLKVEESK